MSSPICFLVTSVPLRCGVVALDRIGRCESWLPVYRGRGGKMACRGEVGSGQEGMWGTWATTRGHFLHAQTWNGNDVDPGSQDGMVRLRIDDKVVKMGWFGLKGGHGGPTSNGGKTWGEGKATRTPLDPTRSLLGGRARGIARRRESEDPLVPSPLGGGGGQAPGAVTVRRGMS